MLQINFAYLLPGQATNCGRCTVPSGGFDVAQVWKFKRLGMTEFNRARDFSWAEILYWRTKGKVFNTVAILPAL